MTKGKEKGSALGAKKALGSAKKSKSKEPPPETESDGTDAQQQLPVWIQQKLLNIFGDAFPAVLTSRKLAPTLQTIKHALFERDFGSAFSNEEFLQAYTIRWSASRALCYGSVLDVIRPHISPLMIPKVENQTGGTDLATPASIFENAVSTLPIVCLGGGAAEIVAIGGWLKHVLTASEDSKSLPHEEAVNGQKPSAGRSPLQVDLTLVDSAAWGDVVQTLQEQLTARPILSNHASSAAKAANNALLPTFVLTSNFRQSDLLQMDIPELEMLLGKQPLLITLFFTLNELYTTSKTSTTTFLLNLTSTAPRDTLFLVLDSPGSYSETTVGKENKRYPMEWLMDHTLLGQDPVPRWEKLVKDVRWFRLVKELQYPIPLENMRYQIHLFRKL